jgi:dihydrofolate reductase
VTLSLIWAQAANGVIGRDGTIPWRLPEDQALFRSLTMGAAVVMGRRTWDSLPDRFRPLPGRRNLVLTRNARWSARGATAVSTLDDAVSVAGDSDLWVIGGAAVYDLALPLADRLVVTALEASYDGDTLAPPVGAGWVAASREPAAGWSESSTGLRYRVTTYVPAPG